MKIARRGFFATLLGSAVAVPVIAHAEPQLAEDPYQWWFSYETEDGTTIIDCHEQTTLLTSLYDGISTAEFNGPVGYVKLGKKVLIRTPRTKETLFLGVVNRIDTHVGAFCRYHATTEMLRPMHTIEVTNHSRSTDELARAVSDQIVKSLRTPKVW